MDILFVANSGSKPTPLCKAAYVYLAVILCLCNSQTAQAMLLGRDLNDDGVFDAYFDTTLNITWLADGNYAYTSGYAANFDPFFHTGANGMDQEPSFTWAATLNYYGVTGWRLPMVYHTDPFYCGMPGTIVFGGTDCGFNVRTSYGSTVYSEMASLWYDTLGNKSYYDENGNGPQDGWGFLNKGPFVNAMDTRGYYTGVHSSLNGSVYLFDTAEGGQFSTVGAPFRYAWAVHDGSVGTGLPEPGTLALFGLGLAGLGFTRRRKA